MAFTKVLGAGRPVAFTMLPRIPAPVEPFAVEELEPDLADAA